MDFNEENIVLIDDNNVETEFEIITKIDVNDQEYFIVKDVNNDSDEAIILKTVTEGKEMTLATVEEDEEFEAVVEAYESLFSDGFLN